MLTLLFKINKLIEELKKERAEKADVIVWLQGDMYDRATKVLNLFNKGFAKKILLSGNNKLLGKGKRSGENNISLKDMAEWLKKRGIKSNQILIDNKAFNTAGQAKNAIRTAKYLRWKNIILVASLYHQPRVFLNFLKEKEKRRWKGKLINQPAQLNLEKIPSGRDEKGKDLLLEELKKIRRDKLQPKTVIEGEKIFLNLLSVKHATKRYADWINDSEVNRWLIVKKTTVDNLKKYIEEKNKSPNCLLLGIFLKENKQPFDKTQGKHIGNIKLEPIDWKRKRGNLGVMIGEKSCWGQGLGSESVRLLCDFAFQKMGLREIYLGVDPENKRGIKFYERLGFKYVGTRKIKVNYEGRITDVIEYGMLLKR